MAYSKNLTKKSEDLSEWYNKIVLDAELADYGPAKGSMIYRPYGYRIWELTQEAMDQEIKSAGVENAYFPVLIPMSFLNREKSHVEGFSPELAVVTIGGGEELKEPLVVRPTSETIMYDAYSRWVHSWRDLPIKINQWNNVVRWEKRTYLFLRGSEFLWQEGHTAHASHEECWTEVVRAMEMYAKIYREYFAMPGIIGRKSEFDKFAGADTTLTYETLMPEGKALQSCTSHDLGQNFAKAFNIKFQDKAGVTQYAWQTSWGFSTRSIGGLIMMHGDDKGLRLPPKLAPIQVVIIPVDSEHEGLVRYCEELQREIEKKVKGVRIKLDDRNDESFGFRINKWEVKGVPICIQVGLREMQESGATVVRRDTGDKEKVAMFDLPQKINNLLKDIQSSLYQEAEEFLKENTHEANSYDEFKNIMSDKRGFIKALWCEERECEEKIKEETKASTRCLPLDSSEEDSSTGSGQACVHCGKPAKHRWIFAQAY